MKAIQYIPIASKVLAVITVFFCFVMLRQNSDWAPQILAIVGAMLAATGVIAFVAQQAKLGIEFDDQYGAIAQLLGVAWVLAGVAIVWVGLFAPDEMRAWLVAFLLEFRQADYF